MSSIQPIAAIQPNRRYHKPIADPTRIHPSPPSIAVEPIESLQPIDVLHPTDRGGSTETLNRPNRSRIPPNPAIASIARGQTVTRRQPTIDRAPDRLSIHHTSIAAISRVLRIIPRRDPPDNPPRHLPRIIVARPPSRLFVGPGLPDQHTRPRRTANAPMESHPGAAPPR